MTTEEIHAYHAAERDTYTAKVLDSTHSMKLVLAGPGTGKSHLFKQVAKKYIAKGQSNIIVLSFINELVKDLAVDMHGVAEVSTLHSFAASQLSKSSGLIDMDLLKVIQKDYEAETGLVKDLEKIYHEQLSGEEAVLAYVSARRTYYGCYEPTTMVHDLVAYYSEDHNRIPVYDLILVDEYQDFNKLEIALIDLLCLKSHIMIAGDDDQSLYSFKHAAPDHIRELSASGKCELFELPYCSRSTEVVINAFHDFVSKAGAEGHLQERLDKKYLYFPCIDKDAVSKANPKIEVLVGLYQSQIAFYLNTHLQKIFLDEPKFDVLIVSPLRRQLESLATALRKMGYRNVQYESSAETEAKELAKGLKYLVDDKDSNLGWRLCAEALIDEEDELGEAIKRTSRCDVAFTSAVSQPIRTLTKKLRAASAKLNDGNTLTSEQSELLFSKLGIIPQDLAEASARDKIFKTFKKNPCSDTKIKLTTILGSKGLSYDYVFLVNFDDKYLIPAPINITDERINGFLVALTRSRKRITVFSSERQGPTFVSWILPTRKKVTTFGR